MPEQKYINTAPLEDFRHEVKTMVAQGALAIGREALNDPRVRKYAADTAHKVCTAATRMHGQVD